ncbi:MAG TPA: DUF6290 family protein [Dehalococcoidia bacterium]|nr:DUF6290 family protein [Dehalococcoidia bacterium]
MTRRETDEEIIAEYDKLLAEGREMEGLVPVKARVAKPVRAVYSVRMSSQELTQISKAARQRAMTVSDFMRQASLAAARDELDLEAGRQEAAFLAVREKARELYQAMEEL